eukprot:7159450-Prymnesium_polylepis.1
MTDRGRLLGQCLTRRTVPTVRLPHRAVLLSTSDDYNWNGIAWAFFFDTSSDAADWEIVEAPFDEFVPTLFARRVPGGGARLNSRSITTVQLVRKLPSPTVVSQRHARASVILLPRSFSGQTLSKFEVDSQLNPKFDTGPFRLELDRVEAF